jgi:hypothetical protein
VAIARPPIGRPPVLASRPLHSPYYSSYPYYPRYGFGFSYGYPWGYAPFGFGFSYGYPGPYYRSGFSVGFSYGYPGFYGYGYSPYWYGFGYPLYGYPAAPAYAVPVPGVAFGGIRLDLSQRNAEVYVDGYLVGTVDDFDGTFQQVKLDPGAHRIEIRAPGYESTSFDVKIEAGRTINYRTDLRQIQ